MTVIKCVCGDERDVHTPKERRGRWYRGACTNTKCACTSFLERPPHPTKTVDSQTFTSARDRIATAIASEFGGDLSTPAGSEYWTRCANAVLALFPPERVAELFPGDE